MYPKSCPVLNPLKKGFKPRARQVQKGRMDNRLAQECNTHCITQCIGRTPEKHGSRAVGPPHTLRVQESGNIIIWGEMDDHEAHIHKRQHNANHEQLMDALLSFVARCSRKDFQGRFHREALSRSDALDQSIECLALEYLDATALPTLLNKVKKIDASLARCRDEYLASTPLRTLFQII